MRVLNYFSSLDEHCWTNKNARGHSIGHASDINFFFSSVTKINLSMEIKLIEIVNFQDSNSL